MRFVISQFNQYPFVDILLSARHWRDVFFDVEKLILDPDVVLAQIINFTMDIRNLIT